MKVTANYSVYNREQNESILLDLVSGQGGLFTHHLGVIRQEPSSETSRNAEILTDQKELLHEALIIHIIFSTTGLRQSTFQLTWRIGQERCGRWKTASS